MSRNPILILLVVSITAFPQTGEGIFTADTVGDTTYLFYNPDPSIIIKPEHAVPSIPSDAPSRPIGQTVVGAVLAASGAAGIIVGAIFALTGSNLQDEDDFIGEWIGGILQPIGTALLIAGSGFCVGGIVFISISDKKWKKYHEWEKKQPGETVFNPGIELTVEF